MSDVYFISELFFIPDWYFMSDYEAAPPDPEIRRVQFKMSISGAAFAVRWDRSASVSSQTRPFAFIN